MAQTEAEQNVPRRQYSLFQPKYEELYTFWWKCMQITLHDKGTQTMCNEEDGDKEKSKELQAEELTKLINGGNSASEELTKLINGGNSAGLQHILSAIDDNITPPQLDLPTDLADSKSSGGENDQLKQLMAMINYYNTVGRENRSKARTFRGAGALAQGISPSMLAPLSGMSLSDIQSNMGPSALGAMVDTTLDSTPVMEQRAQLTPISSSSPSLSASPLKDTPSTTETAAITAREVPEAPTSPSLQASTTVTTSTTTPLLSTPQIMTTPVKSELMEQSAEIKTEGYPSPQSDVDSITDLEQLKASLKLPASSPINDLYEGSENLNDLLQIKQLTDALGRKAVLDSLTVSNAQVLDSLSVSSAQDLSSYLNLIGQLPNTNARSLFNPLGNMSLYMGQAMKTDGAYSSLNSSLSSVKLEHQARHYAANSESDTSIITLPEGFEVDENLTWSEVENFVNEFKTKRVKLGYTQAHVGAALALVHGPEFSQTTISRFEGLQLSFANHKKIIPILRRWLESVENPAKRKHSPNAMHNHHSNNQNSKRRKRTTISSNSKEILEQYYQSNPLPSTEEIGNLSNNLALDKRVIRIWFQNRRAIGKRLSKLIVTMGGGAHHSNHTQLQSMKMEPFGTF